jgi:hypothetical protein
MCVWKLTVKTSETQPESTITTESGGSKGVTGGKLPHPGQELDQSSIEQSHSEDDVGSGDASSGDVEHG